ncbi:MAG: hypothetical protein ACK4TI_03690 [Nitrososphaerales archaeon]
MNQKNMKVVDEDQVETLKQFVRFVSKARRLHKQWDGYCVKQFDQNARQEFQTYQQGFDQTLEQLLKATKLKPKKWDSFRHDKNLLAEKLTRNTFAGARIAYYCAELVAVIKFLTWLFSESKVNVKLKQQWAIDALDDIEVFAYKLIRLICQRLNVENVELDFMTFRPSNIWAANYREALRGFNSGGVRDWRLVPPLIRTSLERAFLEPIFYGRDLKLKKKYIPYEDLHRYLKGSSFGNQLRQLDKLLYIYRWASVHTHWGRRYSIGACWFIANYVADLHVDDELRRWIKKNNHEKFERLLKKLKRDNYIELP